MDEKKYQKEYYLKNRENILRRTLEYYYNHQITNEDFIKRKKKYDADYYYKRRINKKKEEHKPIINISKGITITFP